MNMIHYTSTPKISTTAEYSFELNRNDHMISELWNAVHEIKEEKKMPTKKFECLGVGLYANVSSSVLADSMTNWYVIEIPVKGDRLFLELNEWDGNVKTIQKFITRKYGWLERGLYFSIKGCIEKGLKEKLAIEERRNQMKNAMPVFASRKIYIERVIFNGPATIVFWTDDTKTVVKCGKDETFDPEKGLAMAISKKMFGNQGNYLKEFKRWLNQDTMFMLLVRDLANEEDSDA